MGARDRLRRHPDGRGLHREQPERGLRRAAAAPASAPPTTRARRGAARTDPRGAPGRAPRTHHRSRRSPGGFFVSPPDRRSSVGPPSGGGCSGQTGAPPSGPPPGGGGRRTRLRGTAGSTPRRGECDGLGRAEPKDRAARRVRTGRDIDCRPIPAAQQRPIAGSVARRHGDPALPPAHRPVPGRRATAAHLRGALPPDDRAVPGDPDTVRGRAHPRWARGGWRAAVDRGRRDVRRDP